MLKKLMIAGAALAFLATAQPASAQESFVLKRIKERGVVNMGHRESSVPFAYIGSDGKVQGYSIDLCENGGDKLVHGSGGISQPRAE